MLSIQVDLIPTALLGIDIKGLPVFTLPRLDAFLLFILISLYLRSIFYPRENVRRIFFSYNQFMVDPKNIQKIAKA